MFAVTFPHKFCEAAPEFPSNIRGVTEGQGPAGQLQEVFQGAERATGEMLTATGRWIETPTVASSWKLKAEEAFTRPPAAEECGIIQK